VFDFQKIMVKSLSWLDFSSVLTNNCFSHTIQFTSLVSHDKKVNECFHTIWMTCIWSILKHHNFAVFDQHDGLTYTTKLNC